MGDIYNPFSLSNKYILVTGASSGIGKGIATACAMMGATVYITGRHGDRLNKTLQQLPAGNHKAIIADLTSQDDLQKLINEIPKIDGLVQCAGVGSRVACKAISQTDIDYIMKTNFDAQVLLQTSILVNRKINKSASIVYIASHAANAPTIGNAIYSASKGAIISYAKCLALELAPRKIRVNCICPAMVWTDLIIQEGFTKEEMEIAQLSYPLKRYGQPEDVANLAIYMLSDASAWMTGSAVDITGGSIGL